MAKKRSKSKAKNKTKIISAVLTIIITLVAFLLYEFVLKPEKETYDIPEGSCEFHMIDVGQGDAILIRVDDKNILIDTSEAGEKQKLVDYLKKYNVTEIEYFVATHPDSDHIGNAAYVIENYTIKNVILSPKEHTSKTYEKMISAIEAKVESGEIQNVINPQEAYPEIGYDGLGDSIMVGELELKMLGPIGTFSNSDNNNPSVVIMARWGNNKVLLTGDAETKAEQRIIEEYGSALKCDVLKVGHHGSHSSTWESGLLQYAKPTYATISCGTGNSYGHPHTEAMNALQEHNVTVYRTDLQGSIVVKSDGETITITTEK